MGEQGADGEGKQGMWMYAEENRLWSRKLRWAASCGGRVGRCMGVMGESDEYARDLSMGHAALCVKRGRRLLIAVSVSPPSHTMWGCHREGLRCARRGGGPAFHLNLPLCERKGARGTIACCLPSRRLPTQLTHKTAQRLGQKKGSKAKAKATSFQPFFYCTSRPFVVYSCPPPKEKPKAKPPSALFVPASCPCPTTAPHPPPPTPPAAFLFPSPSSSSFFFFLFHSSRMACASLSTRGHAFSRAATNRPYSNGRSLDVE